jgi:mannosylglucosylglycerate synthase
VSPTPTAVILSFRLGGDDGVSVEAHKWEWALNELGFGVRRVAGELDDGLRPDDVWLAFLAIDAAPGLRPEPDALRASLEGADLVVVENICSLPLNVTASSIVARVLVAHEGRVLFHHHDLPWERAHLAHLTEFPPTRPGSLHITINDHARDALATRGIRAEVIRNAFDLDPAPGDRADTRKTLGFDHDDLIVLQPTRAIPRKQVGRGLEYAQALADLVPERPVRYWLTGAAEDGFGPGLERLLAAATVPTRHQRVPRSADAYAAADVVVFPSSWEGFGNPVIEATIADRPVAAAHYPVLGELEDLGLHVLSIDEPAAAARALQHPDTSTKEANRACLRAHFDLADLPGRLAHAFSTVGWDNW